MKVIKPPIQDYIDAYGEAITTIKREGKYPDFDERRVAFFEAEIKRLEAIRDSGGDFLDVEESRVFKAGIALAVKYIHSRLASRNQIRSDLLHSPHEHIRRVHESLLSVVTDLRGEWQASLIRDIGEALLWVVDKDSAYQDPFLAFLNRLGVPGVPSLPVAAWWMNLLTDIKEWDGH